MYQAEVLTDGFKFVENPRWYDGRLWVSDFILRQVLTVDLGGHVEPVIDVPNQPSGIGWLPDGRLLIVSMLDRKLLRLDDGELLEHADLSAVATWHCNDMVVDRRGRAYVGNFGFDIAAYAMQYGRDAALTDPDLVTAALAFVDVDGSVQVAADGLRFPNGAVITPDGRTLIVAETLNPCLSAFSIEPDGTLSNRRVWAQFARVAPRIVPDGICIDEEGAIWVANPYAPECLRVGEGGTILDRVTTSMLCYACVLGGDDGKTLFLTTNASGEPRRAQIEIAQVDVPGIGYG
jgi:sugar lactone lactonase YvrE